MVDSDRQAVTSNCFVVQLRLTIAHRLRSGFALLPLGSFLGLGLFSGLELLRPSFKFVCDFLRKTFKFLRRFWTRMLQAGSQFSSSTSKSEPGFGSLLRNPCLHETYGVIKGAQNV